ncbi:type II secretion system protein [Rossellomorea vietnamensis]|uniref:type II secretion system protein n=1 Tax=Rossellomorea vietnamensis TaxID=218284 RepID=UPI00054F1D4C|nr:prepilin-type N-terminal cleavage/methylation domain-containing protein [Rossellomorea vietnamensis]
MNERGVTLIEVLATITILSIIGVVIWNVFFQGLNYSDKAVTQNTMQQESNYISMKLTRIHQTSKEYELTSSDCMIKVEYVTRNKGTLEETFKEPDLCLSTNFSGSVDPNKEDLSLTISIGDKERAANKFDLKTVFYRLKENGIE